MQKHVAAWMMFTAMAAGSLCAQEKPAQSAATPAADQKKILSPESFLELRSVQDPQFSPDGSRVAFVVSDPLKGEKRIRHIWLYDKKSGTARQLTFSENRKPGQDGRPMEKSWRSFPIAAAMNSKFTL